MRKAEVDIQFYASLGKQASLKVCDRNGNTIIKFSSELVEKAINKPLKEEIAVKQLNKTGGTPFKIKECRVQMDADISIPLSKLNELRRMALEELETKRKWKRPNVSVLSLNHSNGLAESDLKISEESNFKAGSNKEYTCHYYFRADTRCINDMADRIYLPYDAMLEGNLDIPRACPSSQALQRDGTTNKYMKTSAESLALQ